MGQLVDDLPFGLHMALRRGLQGIHHPQQGGFPGPAETDDPEDVSFFHFQVHMLEGLYRSAADFKRFADILKFDQIQHLLLSKQKEPPSLQRRWFVVPL
nr:hypothetical protein [Acidaminococcus fermentans]